MSNLFEANDPETIRLLLETGVDANTRDRYGKTALFYHLGNSQVLELLIKAGADVNSRDKYGTTPLFNHYRYGHLTGVQFLIDAGADVNALDNGGNNLLFYYSEASPEIMQILIDAGLFLQTHAVNHININTIKSWVRQGIDLSNFKPVTESFSVDFLRFLLEEKRITPSKSDENKPVSLNEH